ncbi:hypothetical protein M1L60_02730 [Actinoplanes sp. TRM 88003]|uniref:Ribosomally synthesized peptide with SipW-like signal peptide n=1 Tax=Paractinoplanes aksuensis TaxID=2939490 RepID=A0ABT1DG90_9ACTN|nr:hypothetical protein [Actinoplanes aksuensis]MCO8269503.1 hypothetical protein [Actinoplanes aksuensis]
MRGIINKAVSTAGTKRRLGRGVATAAGLVACAGIVWSSSHAAFTDTTTNNGNTIGAGTLDITDNRLNATAMFDPAVNTAVAPGFVSTPVCISISNVGTMTPTTTKMYLPTAVAQEREGAGGSYVPWVTTVGAYPAMDDNSTLYVEEGPEQGTDPGSTCLGAGYTDKVGVAAAGPVAAGTNLKSLLDSNNAWGNGISVANIPPGKWRSYRFTYTFLSSAPNAAQGDGIKFGVTWEAQQ